MLVLWTPTYFKSSQDQDDILAFSFLHYFSFIGGILLGFLGDHYFKKDSYYLPAMFVALLATMSSNFLYEHHTLNS
jgi:sugar phosphate permease